MNHIMRVGTFGAFLIGMGCGIFAGEVRAAPPAELSARTDALIDQLEDSDQNVRNAAEAQLISLPDDALTLLESASKRGDLGIEQASRLKHALLFLSARSARDLQKQTRTDWERKMFISAYDAGGHASGPDAALSRAALNSYVEFIQTTDDLQLGLRPELTRNFRKAVDAGATDPLILTLAALADGRADVGDRWRDPDGTALVALKQVLNGSYPLVVKYYVDMDRIEVFENLFSQWPGLYDKFEKLAKDQTLPPRELEHLAFLYFIACYNRDPDEKIIPKFLDMFSAAAPNSTYPLTLKAMAHVRTANQLVNGKLPSDRDWKVYYDELQQGLGLLETAWKKDPADSRVTIRALQILREQQEKSGGRPVMETWFARAVEAEPDSAEPYRWKLRYLLDRGDPEHKAYLNFARDCLRTQNYHSGVPALLIEAHLQVADLSSDNAEYFAQPAVWTDIQSYYETDLLIFPENTKSRCEYAQLAARCGHWDVVFKQCQIIGDKPSDPPFKSIETYNYLRKKAQRLHAAANN